MTIQDKKTEIKSAQIFTSEPLYRTDGDSLTDHQSHTVKSPVYPKEALNLIASGQADTLDDVDPVQPPQQKRPKKWLGILAILVVVASVAELVYFVIEVTQRLDWLAGIWFIIFAVLVGVIIKTVWAEWRGLKCLKRQQVSRRRSQHLFDTPAIGSAIVHCNQLAENFPQCYQKELDFWRRNIQPSYTDNEVITLFEKQAMKSLDRDALKVVSQNASAAGVMIAVSPFALLDMMIVVWRNIKMINQVSEVYGVNLGYWGRVRLVKNVFYSMVYAGAAEILSDAGTYALGAGVTGKLSTRVAQGLGASVLTARIGLKAVAESRPMPFLAEPKPSLSTMTKQLLADLTNRIN